MRGRRGRGRAIAGLLVAAGLGAFLLLRPASDAGEQEGLTSAAAKRAAPPSGQGFATEVRTGVQFVQVDGIDENAGTFDATVDVRLRWKDPTWTEAVAARDDDVAAAFAGHWAPAVAIDNLVDDPALVERGLKVDGHGNVELLERTKGTFATDFDVQSFPFDRQLLTIVLAARGQSLDDLSLVFHGDDLAFAANTDALSVPAWTTGVVSMASTPTGGWYNQGYARLTAGLNVRRDWQSTIAPVFIPLFSAMLIPLIAVWLQKVSDEGEFEIDAFELANIVIGGLFAVIALNFTVNSAYATLAIGDNTVTRLFGLCYSALALAMAIVVGKFQFNLVSRWFGKYVQEQLYHVLSWAVPVLTFGASAAFLLVAWY